MLHYPAELWYNKTVIESKLLKASNILKNAGCTSVYLFGSQAKGNARSDSDIDLGVFGLVPSLFFKTHFLLENELDMKVDLVDFDHEKSFYEMLEKIGELKKIG